jgi:hypothetical protein
MQYYICWPNKIKCLWKSRGTGVKTRQWVQVFTSLAEEVVTTESSGSHIGKEILGGLGEGLKEIIGGIKDEIDKGSAEWIKEALAGASNAGKTSGLMQQRNFVQPDEDKRFLSQRPAMIYTCRYRSSAEPSRSHEKNSEIKCMFPPNATCDLSHDFRIARTRHAQTRSLLDKPFAKSLCLWNSRDKSLIAFSGNSAVATFTTSTTTATSIPTVLPACTRIATHPASITITLMAQ